MHAEALCWLRTALGYASPSGASLRPLPGHPPVMLEGTPAQIGWPSDRPGFAFDNELPSQRVEVAPFEIDGRCVSAGEYQRFVDAGGYDDPANWPGGAGHWRKEAGRSHPARWRRAPAGSGDRWQHRWFDRWLPLDPDQPVIHVNAYAADAARVGGGGRAPHHRLTRRDQTKWRRARRRGLGRRLVKRIAACLFLVVPLLVRHAGAAEPVPDPWTPVARLIGNWSGTSSGPAGEGSVQRGYAFVMSGRYIHETNTSTYAPQEKNKTGEVHEHWGMISFDKQRKTLVLRRFHVESFVNTYRRVETPANSPAAFVFESESFENFNNAWKDRETCEFLSDDEFAETFELAAPGQPYKTYSRTQLKRVAR